MLKIFLAHAKEDEKSVSYLYKRLKEKGYDPWLDKEDLLPGQNWRVEIPKAIRNSQIFIACLSQRSVAKQGYVQREFRMALNEYANKPPNSIYLVPLRLDNCSIPDLRQEEYGINLRDIQWVDLFEANGFDRLVRALEHSFPKSHSIPSTIVSPRLLNIRQLQARKGKETPSGVGQERVKDFPTHQELDVDGELRVPEELETSSEFYGKSSIDLSGPPTLNKSVAKAVKASASVSAAAGKTAEEVQSVTKGSGQSANKNTTTKKKIDSPVVVGERLLRSHTLSTQAPGIAAMALVALLGLTTMVSWLRRSPQPPVANVPGDLFDLGLPAQIEIAFEQNKVDVATALTEELIAQGGYADAIAALDTAKPRQRKDVIVSFLKGRSKWGLAQQADSDFEPGDAMHSWMTALEDEPDWMEISMALGFAQLATGREALALESWRKAIKLAEQQPDGKGIFSAQPASEYVLNAYAGKAIAALSLSKIDIDPAERGRLMNEASEAYRRVINEAPADFNEDVLDSNWLWLEDTIVKWEEAKEELSQTLK